MDMQKNPPKSIEEFGTHLFYMARDLTEIKQTLKDTPTRKEMDDMRLRVLDLEVDIERLKTSRVEAISDISKNYVSKGEFKIGLGTVTVILTIAVTLFSLWDYIKS